jgi:aspartyl-tRNA(Asn)/glutamyl-tRNA(Gln) amidotransferase subunit C
MHVDDALIEKLSRLSMLQFSAEEKEAIRQDLQKMIGFIGKLQELDTSGTSPLLHLGAGGDPRADLSGAMLSTEAALQPAPLHNGQYFQVPRVINKPD